MPRKKSDLSATFPGLELESIADRLSRLSREGELVAGVDEAGRGPWAGPVVTAAVILDPSRIPDGLTDSKVLSVRERERLFDEILEFHHVAIASASATCIDAMNIRAATLGAMSQAVGALPVTAKGILVDGRDVPSGLQAPAASLIKGDALVPAISAASVIAKVTRDRMMRFQADHYPGYGFEIHLGYGTAAHAEALNRLGACRLHRQSFRPVREVIAGGQVAWGRSRGGSVGAD